MDKIRITVEELPELETEVALAGSVKQQEVGAILCLGVAAVPMRRRGCAERTVCGGGV